MARSPVASLAVLVFVAAAAPAASQPQRPQPKGLRGRLPPKASSSELSQLLLGFAEAATAPSSGAATAAAEVPAARLRAIEAMLAPTYRALPKNVAGRLTPRGARHLLRHYFAEQHMWLITGLEPHGMREDIRQVHDVAIIQDHAPALIDALLAGGRLHAGLGLEDVAATAALLERLLMNEGTPVLLKAYEANKLSTGAMLSEELLTQVIVSYLFLFHHTNHTNLADYTYNVDEFKQIEPDSWHFKVAEWGKDMVRNFIFARRHRTNPFVAPTFSFEDATRALDEVIRGYGKLQNTECGYMRDDLMGIEVGGLGLVPLKRFYGHSSRHGYLFHESKEYLRRIGALDETVPRRPHVRIANYLNGPSNCIAAPSGYMSHCCINECEALIGELEDRVRAPTAPPGHLLNLAAAMSSSTVDAPRALSRDLETRLRDIAAQNGGEVPLHGRLFAQWLHFAFPRECPYPHAAEDAVALDPRLFSMQHHAITNEERMRWPIANSTESLAALGEPRWIEQEFLPLIEQPRRATFGDIARVATMLALCFAVLRGGWRSVSAAVSAYGGGGQLQKRQQKSDLPLYD